MGMPLLPCPEARCPRMLRGELGVRRHVASMHPPQSDTSSAQCSTSEADLRVRCVDTDDVPPALVTTDYPMDDGHTAAGSDVPGVQNFIGLPSPVFL